MSDDTSALDTAKTRTWIEWGVGWPSPYSPSGKLWDMLEYDDEVDAREHLEQHGSTAFLVSRQVTATFWGRT